jgi:hypothetical protein
MWKKLNVCLLKQIEETKLKYRILCGAFGY